jgi:hypothetical protein
MGKTAKCISSLEEFGPGNLCKFSQAFLAVNPLLQGYVKQVSDYSYSPFYCYGKIGCMTRHGVVTLRLWVNLKNKMYKRKYFIVHIGRLESSFDFEDYEKEYSLFLMILKGESPKTRSKAYSSLEEAFESIS